MSARSTTSKSLKPRRISKTRPLNASSKSTLTNLTFRTAVSGHGWLYSGCGLVFRVRCAVFTV